MRRGLRMIAAPIRAVVRAARRGQRRWTGSPVGVQVGLIIGVYLSVNVWDAAPWAAFALLLLAAPTWIERGISGGIKRLLAALRRKPSVALVVVPLYEVIHLLVPLEHFGGLTGVAGAAAGALLVFALGIPADRRPADDRPEASFVATPAPRLAHAWPSLLTLLGAVLIIGGTYLPWASLNLRGVAIISANGIHGPDAMATDGAVTVIAGGLILIAGAARLSARGHAGWRRGIAIGLGLGLTTLSAWIGGSIAAQIATFPPDTSGSIGPGVIVIGFGGAFAFVGGLLPGRPTRSTAERTPLSAGAVKVNW
jgi:hypothetical protein